MTQVVYPLHSQSHTEGVVPFGERMRREERSNSFFKVWEHSSVLKQHSTVICKPKAARCGTVCGSINSRRFSNMAKCQDYSGACQENAVNRCTGCGKQICSTHTYYDTGFNPYCRSCGLPSQGGGSGARVIAAILLPLILVIGMLIGLGQTARAQGILTKEFNWTIDWRNPSDQTVISLVTHQSRQVHIEIIKQFEREMLDETVGPDGFSITRELTEGVKEIHFEDRDMQSGSYWAQNVCPTAPQMQAEYFNNYSLQLTVVNNMPQKLYAKNVLGDSPWNVVEKAFSWSTMGNVALVVKLTPSDDAPACVGIWWGQSEPQTTVTPTPSPTPTNTPSPTATSTATVEPSRQFLPLIVGGGEVSILLPTPTPTPSPTPILGATDTPLPCPKEGQGHCSTPPPPTPVATHTPLPTPK